MSFSSRFRCCELLLEAALLSPVKTGLWEAVELGPWCSELKLLFEKKRARLIQLVNASGDGAPPIAKKCRSDPWSVVRDSVIFNESFGMGPSLVVNQLRDVGISSPAVFFSMTTADLECKLG